MISGLNRWLDGIQEPWRFLLALSIAGVGFVLLSAPYLILKIAGAVYISLLLLVRMANRNRRT